MTTLQRIVRYLAIALAVCLVVSIVGGVLSVIGLAVGWFGSDAVLAEEKDYRVSTEVTHLEIEIHAATLSIVQGDFQKDEIVIRSNLANLEVREEGGTLYLTDTAKYPVTYEGATLTLEIPSSAMFQDVKIETGAGRVDIFALFVRTLEMDFGAGDVTFGYLAASEFAKLEGGAGNVCIRDGGIMNFALDLGTGSLELCAALEGSCEINCAVGNADIVLLGEKDGYSIDVNKGIGRVTVDGERLGDGERYGNGPAVILLDTGVGSATVEFEQRREHE